MSSVLGPASRLITLAALVLGAALAPARAAASVTLDSVEALRLRAGILRAEDERDASDHLLREALRSRDQAIRARAVRALGRIGDPSSVAAVRTFLVDGIPAVQHEAVFALGEIESGEAREALVHVLGSKDPEERALAVEALSKIAAREPALATLCGRSVVDRVLAPGREKDPAVLRRALQSSWRFTAGPEGMVHAISTAFLRSEPGVSEAAIHAAARLADARFAPLLALAAHDERPSVRALAASGLGRLARLPGEAAVKSDEHRAILVRRGLDRDPLPRIAAFGALAAFPPDTRMAAEMLAPSLHGDDPGVARAALALVKAWKVGATADELRAMALGADDDLAVDALGALAAVAGDEAIDALTQAAQDEKWARRAAVAEALGATRLASGAGRSLADRLLADGDARVKAAAVEAAVAAGRDDASVLALAHLADDDIVVRAIAASAVADLVERGALEPAEALRSLRRAWSDALADTSPDARLAALEATERILGGDLSPMLARAATDHDHALRLRAQALAREAGVAIEPVGIVGANRPMSFYAEAAKDEIAAEPRHLHLETTRGALDVQLAPADAILTVRHLGGLAGAGYFDGLTFHRVVPAFVAQGGDPRGDGWGGPGEAIRCEINRLRYDRGAAGMALSGKDTGGSQFFFTLTEQPHLDGGYTVFGHLSKASLPVLDQIRRFDVITSATVRPGLAPDAPAACCACCPAGACCCPPGQCCCKGADSCCAKAESCCCKGADSCCAKAESCCCKGADSCCSSRGACARRGGGSSR